MVEAAAQSDPRAFRGTVPWFVDSGSGCRALSSPSGPFGAWAASAGGLGIDRGRRRGVRKGHWTGLP